MKNENGFMSIAEVHEHTKMLAGELDDALGKIARLQVDLHQTVMDCERYKEALEEILHSTNEVHTEFVAREALADRP